MSVTLSQEIGAPGAALLLLHLSTMLLLTNLAAQMKRAALQMSMTQQRRKAMLLQVVTRVSYGCYVSYLGSNTNTSH